MFSITQATIDDVDQIFDLIKYFNEKKLILLKSVEEIRRDINHFIVCRDSSQGKVIACGYLHVYDEHLVEIRSLVVSPHYQKQGIGRSLVLKLIDLARKGRYDTIFTLTKEVNFFLNLLFKKISIESLPKKILKDCSKCASYPNCGETALIYEYK